MSTEPDIDEDLPHGTQILWGRVLVLLLALALAFWLGTTFGGDSAARQEITEQRNEIARLEAQIATMEAQIAAVGAGRDESAPAGSPDAPSEVVDGVEADPTARRDQPTEPPADEQAAARPRGRSYVIQSGDSLASIAQEVYGDPTRWREIARANDLNEPYSLTVGESLRIPPAP